MSLIQMFVNSWKYFSVLAETMAISPLSNHVPKIFKKSYLTPF